MKAQELAAGGWPGLESSAEPSATDADLDQALTASLGTAIAQAALDKLCPPCVRDEVVSLLRRIRRSADWEVITAKQLESAVASLKATREHLAILKASEFGRQIFERMNRADQLRKEVEWVIDRIDGVLAQAPSGKKTPRSDDAKAALTDYVRSTTGQYHDVEVSFLIECALGVSGENDAQPYSAEAHRMWRYRRGLVDKT